MAVPLYCASPINTNAPISAFPMSPSTFAVRYTPASALEDQLVSNATLMASSIPLPPSQPSTPSPEARRNQTNNSISYASNAYPPSPTPLKAQPSQVNSTASSTPTYTPIRTPSLTRLSIPSTPPPKTIPHAYTATSHSPVSQPSSTYSPPHLPHHSHTRNMSSISALSAFDLNTPFTSSQTIPTPAGNNPPGYVQNTRDSFEDRPVADVEEQTYAMPRSPLRHGYNAGATPFYTANEHFQTNNRGSGHQHKKSIAGPGILNGEIFFQPLDGSLAGGVFEGDDEQGAWEVAGRWAKMAYKKLGEAEEGVWRVVSGER